MRIESYFTTRRDVSEALASGAVNLAIDAPLIDDPSLEQEPLGRDQYACMLRQDHPFSKRKLTIDDYLGFGHIHVSSRRQGPGLVDAELNKLGLRRSIQIRVQHYLVAPLIAMRTDLALTAPLKLLKRYDARILALPFDLPDIESHSYWHRSVTGDPAHRWLREQVGRLNIPVWYHENVSSAITAINFPNDACLGIVPAMFRRGWHGGTLPGTARTGVFRRKKL
jgi:DNA-binding transcriptional LysR family regulator